MTYDIIILGSGPAGLTAALYGARANKKVLVLGGSSLGGQLNSIPNLENYPGFKGSGPELAEFMKAQAESFGAEVKMEICTKLEKTDALWTAQTENGTYSAKVAIVATGASPKKLTIDNCQKLVGKGVSYCATCDGFFYTGKDVAVYGGGNSALNDALYLANIAKKVYIIYRKPSFSRAEDCLVKRAAAAKNIEFVFNTEIKSLIENESGLTGLKTNTGSDLAVDGLFVAIGHEANTDFLGEEYKRDSLGKITTEVNGTKVADGLFVSGDVRSNNKMQICVATGWGCEAAMDAIAYINKL